MHDGTDKARQALHAISVFMTLNHFHLHSSSNIKKKKKNDCEVTEFFLHIIITSLLLF